VDVALIPYYFGSKESLFTASMEVPVRPEDLIEKAFAEGPERAGPRLVEMFLDLWEEPTTGPAIRTLFRSATTHEESRRALSEFATTAVLGRYAAHLTGPDARRRAALAASQLVGMAMLRYLVRIEPAVSMTREQLVADLGPTVQRYLTGPLDSAPEP
jgi:AcrR family transcriptional regulator